MSKSTILSSSCKSFKTLRIRKKKIPESLPTNDDSFIDEDPSNFFSIPEDIDFGKSVDELGNFKPRSYIGQSPSSKSPLPKQVDHKKSMQFRGSIIRLQPLMYVDHNKRFQDILTEIQKNKAKAKREEKTLAGKLSPREKIMNERQKKIIEGFEKKKKYWSNLEKNLSERTLKPSDKLLSTIHENSQATQDIVDNHIQENFYWYLNLRSEAIEKSKTYVPFGSSYQGLFTCIKGKVSNNSGFLPKSQDLDELQIIGLGKLPLEIEAVKSKGNDLLNTDLIDKSNYDEVIFQHQDKKFKASQI